MNADNKKYANESTSSVNQTQNQTSEKGNQSDNIQNDLRNCIKLLPGEYYVTNKNELIMTVLGSCISACMRDSIHGIGGMNHFMLPIQTGAYDSWGSSQVSLANRYGNHAMENLINDILKLGGKRKNLELKVFGGGKILEHMTDVGQRNIEFIEQFITTEGLKISAKDVGSTHPRKLLYDPISGRARVKKLGTPHKDSIIERENRYLIDIQTDPVAGKIELF